MSKRGFGVIRRLPSKRHQASYCGPDMVRHLGPTTFTTKADAERPGSRTSGASWSPETGGHHGTAKRSNRASRRWRHCRSTPIVWLPQQRVRGEPLRPSTMLEYDRALRLYIKPHLGDKPLPEISRAHVREWHHKQLGHVKDRARAKAYAVLRTIMNSAVEDELIDASPVSIRGGGTARRKHGIEPASLDELAIIVARCPSGSA